MNKKELIQEIKIIMINELTLDMEIEELDENMKFSESDLDLDSLDFMTLSLEIEKKYGVEITSENRQAFESVNSLCDFILSNCIKVSILV